MIGLIQRVSQANVTIGGKLFSQINKGLLVFIGVEKKDTVTQADKLLHRLLNYRVFADNNNKMNLSVQDIQGQLLLVPQFTLPADTQKGNRPSFTPAADPQTGHTLFHHLLDQAKQHYPNHIQSGQFGADMQVNLSNNGPVTFWLQVK
jgi:D-tyrosyl-tRNA(Tyr) deacylase